MYSAEHCVNCGLPVDKSAVGLVHTESIRFSLAPMFAEEQFDLRRLQRMVGAAQYLGRKFESPDDSGRRQRGPHGEQLDGAPDIPTVHGSLWRRMRLAHVW